MTRFLLFLLGKTGYESCKSCETLKMQLSIANQEKAQLTETLLSLIKPKTYEATPTALEPMQPKLMPFSRRRAMLEEQERVKAQVRQGPHISTPTEDKSIEKLEEELGVKDAN